MNQNNFFEAIFIQYGTLGIAITTIIPMAIFFYVVHNLQIGTFGRKIFWTIYAVTLGAIWVSKSNEINPVANWIYGLTFLILIIFIFLDKSIHSYFGVSDFKKFVKDGNKKAIREAKKALDEIKEHFKHRRMNFTEFKRETKQLEDYIKELSKE
jgi:branched-subunit amino acid transport protein